MGLSPLTLTNLAFKNIVGKSLGWTNSDWYAEPKSISFNVTSDTVWIDTISSTASIAVANNVALNVSCPMVGIDESQPETGQFHAYQLTWPPIVPSGNDPITGNSFSYNSGVLIGITAGDDVRNIISDKYGSDYFPRITMSDDSELDGNDVRSWYLQYNSGVFYQDNINTPNPTTASVYVYIGNTLKSQPNTLYTNGSYSETFVGGILPHTSFDKVATNNLFDMMFYPSTQPSFASFNIQGINSTYEIGNNISAGSYTMSWIISNSSSIVSNSIYIYGTNSEILYGPTNNSGKILRTFGSIQYNTPNVLTYSITAETNRGIVIGSVYNINWNYGIYYGSSTQSLLTTYGGFLSYQNNLNGNYNGTYILPGGTFSTYKYILIPDSFATISNIYWNNMPVVMADSIDGYTWSANNLNYHYINFSNVSGITSPYKVYRTKNKLAATMSNINIV
jgi:hypothetical protein